MHVQLYSVYMCTHILVSRVSLLAISILIAPMCTSSIPFLLEVRLYNEISSFFVTGRCKLFPRHNN